MGEVTSLTPYDPGLGGWLLSAIADYAVAGQLVQQVTIALSSCDGSEGHLEVRDAVLLKCPRSPMLPI